MIGKARKTEQPGRHRFLGSVIEKVTGLAAASGKSSVIALGRSNTAVSTGDAQNLLIETAGASVLPPVSSRTNSGRTWTSSETSLGI